MRPFIAAVVVGLLLAGCGGGSATDDVKGTLKGFFVAYANGDGKKACGYLSPAGRGDLVSGTVSPTVEQCVEDVNGLAGAGQEDAKNQFRTAAITNITIDGDTAYAHVGDASLVPKLSKHDGRWLIDSVGF